MFGDSAFQVLFKFLMNKERKLFPDSLLFLIVDRPVGFHHLIEDRLLGSMMFVVSLADIDSRHKWLRVALQDHSPVRVPWVSILAMENPIREQDHPCFGTSSYCEGHQGEWTFQSEGLKSGENVLTVRADVIFAQLEIIQIDYNRPPVDR